MKHVLVAICTLAALPVMAADAENGLTLSKKLCDRCHAIDPAKPWDSIGSTPSFMLMARKLDSYEVRIQTVSGRRPHIGQKLEPSNEELEDILAYIKTLVE